jgi:hypothetical protein
VSMMEVGAAEAAVAAGDWETAERHFDAVLRCAVEEGLEGVQPAVSLSYAKALLERGAPGDAERARALIEDALPIFERAGATYPAQTCRELLAG